MNYQLIASAGILRFIKNRIKAWLGHVMRMEDKRTCKKILEWKSLGTRIRGRRMKRWIAVIEEDMKIARNKSLEKAM